jgi:PDZ domain-containing secreted protein
MFGQVGLLEAIIVIMLIIFIVAFFFTKPGEVSMVRSGIDNRVYLVQNLPDKQQAADLLASINVDIIKLLKHLTQKFSDNEDIKYLIKNFDPNNVSESGRRDIYTSYSVNKGEKIVLCLRSRDTTNELEDKNIIMYVVIHELAHLMTRDVGHTAQFWENNKLLLKEAINVGIYTRVDFDNSPAKYCGIKITTSVA